jgi:L-ascorbate metabolism protein UlaG (beta-lactamase superfamily)
MRIVFLGTSHGSHTHSRYNSSTLLETNGSHYLVDCGEPAAGTLVRSGIGLERLRALFITHLHADHVGGLAQLTNMLVKRGDPSRVIQYCLPEEGLAGIVQYLHTLYLDLTGPGNQVRLLPVRPGLIYRDEEMAVSAFHSAHLSGSFAEPRVGPEPRSRQSFSYLMVAEGKRVAFTGDLSGALRGHALDHLGEEPLDLLVMEMTHIKPPDILPVVARMPVRQVAFYHIHDPWHDEGEATLRQYCDEHLSCPYLIAHDGDELVL